MSLVVTSAIGSLLASTILFKNVPVVEGGTAAGGLIGLQYLVAKLSVRNERVRNWVKAVFAALRSSGISHLADVAALALASNARVSVIPRPERAAVNTLRDVEHVP